MRGGIDGQRRLQLDPGLAPAGEVDHAPLSLFHELRRPRTRIYYVAPRRSRVLFLEITIVM